MTPKLSLNFASDWRHGRNLVGFPIPPFSNLPSLELARTKGLGSVPDGDGPAGLPAVGSLEGHGGGSGSDLSSRQLYHPCKVTGFVREEPEQCSSQTVRLFQASDADVHSSRNAVSRTLSPTHPIECFLKKSCIFLFFFFFYPGKPSASLSQTSWGHKLHWKTEVREAILKDILPNLDICSVHPLSTDVQRADLGIQCSTKVQFRPSVSIQSLTT